jgi:hypothetical protein
MVPLVPKLARHNHFHSGSALTLTATATAAAANMQCGGPVLQHGHTQARLQEPS